MEEEEDRETGSEGNKAAADAGDGDTDSTHSKDGTAGKLVSRWLIQKGRDQNRRGPRRIKAKKRRQLLLQRKRYYISASSSACVRTLIVFHYRTLAILCHIHLSRGQVTGGSLCDMSFIQVEGR